MKNELNSPSPSPSIPSAGRSKRPLDERKTPWRGARIVRRGKTLELAGQEFHGLLLAHFAIRGLLHEAALEAGEDPDRLSFSMPPEWSAASLPSTPLFPPRRRKDFPEAVLDEILDERAAARRGRRHRRGVKRKMSSFPPRANGPPLAPIPDIQEHIRSFK